jgi:hypothetical protein
MAHLASQIHFNDLLNKIAMRPTSQADAPRGRFFGKPPARQSEIAECLPVVKRLVDCA